MLENLKKRISDLIPNSNKGSEIIDPMSDSDYKSEDAKPSGSTNDFLELVKENIPLVASLSLAILSIFFFLVITQEEVFSSLSFFRVRWFGLGTIIASGVVTYIGAFWNKSIPTKFESYIAFIHSFLLTTISYAYLLRLNNGGLAFFEYELNTSIVFVPLSILIFAANYTVFNRIKHIQLLTVAQVLFILLFSYSIIGFINVDDSFARNFNQGWLSVIFNWPAWIWLFFGSFAISFVSSHNIPHPNTERRILYLGGYYFMTLQVLLAMYILNFSYWYQTLLALISWNFIYTNILSQMTKKNDLKYKPRLAISIIYHALLFLIVLYVG